MALPRLHCVSGAIDVADITVAVTAANTIVAADTSKRYKVVDVDVRAIGGDAGGSTAIFVMNGTKVPWTAATTNIDEGVIMRSDTTNVTATDLGAWGEGDSAISMIRSGTVTTTATSLDYVVWYLVEGCN